MPIEVTFDFIDFTDFRLKGVDEKIFVRIPSFD
jgi:hypothetical protein